MISTPVAIQKRVNTLIHQFIWNGPDTVKRSEMSANYDEGGLKMIDIFTKIKAQQLMWLKRFFSGNQVGWKFILSYYLKNTGGLKFLLQCNFNIQKLACHIPQFYVNILNAWSEITYCKPDTVEKIKNQIIWSSNESVLSTIISFQIYIPKKRDFTKKILKKSSPHYCLLRFLQNFFLKIAFF